MEPIKERILEHSERLPEGAILAPKAFLHLGSRAAVDQALSRLARSGKLLRIARGRYVRPRCTRFGIRAPSPGAVVEQLGRATGETIVPSGAAAAHALGLTTQVPVRPVFLTSGSSRRLHLGKQVIELRHAPAWQLWGAGRKEGAVLRALEWLGPAEAHQAAQRVVDRLSQREREDLLAVSGTVPTWVARTLTEALLAEGPELASPAHA